MNWPAPDLQRVVERLHARGPARELVMAEVGLLGTRGDNEIVVAQLQRGPAGTLGAHHPRPGIDADHLGQHALHVALVLEHVAQRRGDLPLGQDPGGALHYGSLRSPREWQCEL